MKKPLIFVAAVALTGGSYFLLTQVNKGQEEPTSPQVDKLDVEEFDAAVGDDTAGGEYYENDYDRYDDPTSGMLDGQADEQMRNQMQQVNAADVEPIDDADAPSQAPAKEQGSVQDTSTKREPLTTARSR